MLPAELLHHLLLLLKIVVYKTWQVCREGWMSAANNSLWQGLLLPYIICFTVLSKNFTWSISATNKTITVHKKMCFKYQWTFVRNKTHSQSVSLRSHLSIYGCLGSSEIGYTQDEYFLSEWSWCNLTNLSDSIFVRRQNNVLKSEPASRETRTSLTEVLIGEK